MLSGSSLARRRSPQVTVKQLAVLEPSLVQTIACMLGAFFNLALQETVKTGVPEPAAKAMLFRQTQIALANDLRGDNPFGYVRASSIEPRYSAPASGADFATLGALGMKLKYSGS